VSPHGYSGKTLSQKLGLKPGLRLAALHPPPHYGALVGELPQGAAFVDDPQGADIVHLFVTDRADLARRSAGLIAALKPGAALWVSWAKKSSPLFVDLTEGGVREAILPSGWVDVKVCAVDADWSGLKFLRRRL
jgi:hypothetical protein